jgi:death-on-curing protein
VKSLIWLEEKTVRAIHSLAIAEHGGSDGVRDENMLASALNRPRDKAHYDEKCTLFDIAAAYSFALAKNHPFVDGNKRTAFICGILLLELNGLYFRGTEAESALVFENLAAGTIAEKDLSDWFQQNSSSTP